MGLEDTELLMRMEDTFGLRIEDDFDFEDVQSVGDLYYTVRTHLSGRPSRRCHAPYAYFQLREKIIEITGALKSELPLKAPLREVLSIRERMRLWRNLEGHSELRLPPLETAIPEWIIMAFAIATGILIAVCLGVVAATHGMWLSVSTWVFCVFMIPGVIGMQIQRALRFAFPDSCANVGEFVTQTVKRTYGPSEWSGDRVWRQLRDAVAEAYGIPQDEVTPDLRFEELY